MLLTLFFFPVAPSQLATGSMFDLTKIGLGSGSGAKPFKANDFSRKREVDVPRTPHGYGFKLRKDAAGFIETGLITVGISSSPLPPFQPLYTPPPSAHAAAIVDDEGAAGKAGLRTVDQILEINDTPVDNLTVEGIEELIRENEEASLRLVVRAVLRHTTVIRGADNGLGFVLRGTHPVFVRRLESSLLLTCCGTGPSPSPRSRLPVFSHPTPHPFPFPSTASSPTALLIRRGLSLATRSGTSTAPTALPSRTRRLALFPMQDVPVAQDTHTHTHSHTRS